MTNFIVTLLTCAIKGFNLQSESVLLHISCTGKVKSSLMSCRMRLKGVDCPINLSGITYTRVLWCQEIKSYLVIIFC